MTFDEVLEKVRQKAAESDISGIDFLAAQINITGGQGGVFYVEVRDGKISVEPYEYNDRSCEISISGDDLVKLLDGKLDPVAAFTIGKLKVNGDIGKALQFADFIKKNKK